MYWAPLCARRISYAMNSRSRQLLASCARPSIIIDFRYARAQHSYLLKHRAGVRLISDIPQVWPSHWAILLHPKPATWHRCWTSYSLIQGRDSLKYGHLREELHQVPMKVEISVPFTRFPTSNVTRRCPLKARESWFSATGVYIVKKTKMVAHRG